jgi:hypothetical protein
MATVKIETAVVIEALEQAINKLHADYAMQESLEREYQAASEAWKKEIIAYAIKHIETATEFRTNYREWKEELNIDYNITIPKGTLPEQPTRNFEHIGSREYKDTVAEISKELRILKLTKDEYVSASTLKSVGQYL